MATSFDTVRSVVVAAAVAWDDGGPRVQRARERLLAIEAASVELEPPLAGLGSLQHGLDELDSMLISDPLTFDVAELDALEHRLAALEAEVGAVRQAQVGFDDDVDDARALLRELTEAVDAARRAETHVRERVLTSTEVPPLDLDARGAELERITTLAQAGAWRTVAADLARWRDQVERERRTVETVSAEHQRLLAERQLLRGRLDAYTAKAGRLRHVEDPGLEELQRQATELLFRAPVDLAVAADAVQQYQQALTALAEGSRAAP
jgi:chromosome segregation ATPase